MKQDFDTVINRKNTDCAKWDFGSYDHPMWVADMDFKAAPKIAELLKKELATMSMDTRFLRKGSSMHT